MAYSPKESRERAARFERSWDENDPTTDFNEHKLSELKTDRRAVLTVEDEIAASQARTKALQTQRNNLNKALMKKCDEIADGVAGTRKHGPNSPLYVGFGYIAEQDKKRAGGRKPKAKSTP